MSECPQARPVAKSLYTPGVLIMLSMVAAGIGFAVYRYIYGLGAATNLSDQYPWGIWIAIDVTSGVALAAGGFMTSALAHIFHKNHYRAIVRPALLTAALGYTFVALSLFVDLGKYYDIWHPLLPSLWQGNSAMFEVAMCVVTYLAVLYLECVPLLVEGIQGNLDLPKPLSRFRGPVQSLLEKGWVQSFATLSDRLFKKVMFVFIIAGVVLSCMHQSSLGALMLIAPYKVHPLWYTPVLTLLFLLSAMAVGYPMVIIESMTASRVFGRKPEMEILGPLARYIPVFLGSYLLAKAADLVIRNAHLYVCQGTLQSTMFLIEMIPGVLVPFLMLLSHRLRNTPSTLFLASLLIVLGVVLNRINVFLVAYTSPYATRPYVPAIGEIAITLGMIAGLVLCYRVLVSVLPVLPSQGEHRVP